MKRFIYIFILILVVAGFFLIYPAIEWSSPEIDVSLDSKYIGVEPFDIEIRDQGKGIKNVRAVIKTAKGETELLNKSYPSGVKGDIVEIALDPQKLGIGDGEVELEVIAEDHSRLKIFSGNKTTYSKQLLLDLEPPDLDIISTDQYLNHGGSGLVVYRTSPDVSESGVILEEYYFPGYKADFPGEDVYYAFFAYPHDVEPDKNIFVAAIDKAGNMRERGLDYKFKNINYRESDINISDNFINNVVGPLSGNAEKELKKKEIFLKVNNALRKQNDATIKKATTNSSGEMMWEGPFTQLSNSKVEANFADKRTYVYNDEPIDQQYHLGYDLAVTKRYPIEAANNGIIVYAGDLGIYGKTVIIDHGMGVATLYGHMSSIDVKEGDKIKKDEIIGKTGESGLAAGDHLHYGVYINGVAVRPIEWWDKKWINDKIMLKIREAEAEFGKQEASTSTDSTTQ